ncbi:MAG: PEP-CTERM sorting domain-containing protein [Fimbriimonadaceae bacterium]
MKSKSLLILGLCLTASVSFADGTIDFTKLVSGALPNGPSPWGSVSLVNLGANRVSLTLTNNMSLASGQFISRLWLNIVSVPTNLSLVSKSANVSSATWGTNAMNQNGYQFDLQMKLPTANNNDGRLSGGESATIVLDGTGLDSSKFMVTANGPAGPLMGLIHIQDIDCKDSAKVGAVPEPASMAAIGLGIATLLRRRRK